MLSKVSNYMADIKKKSIETLSFEESIGELESIIKDLEAGNIELDKAIELYQKGVMLKQYCSTKLDQAKLRVDKIIHEKGKAIEVEPSNLNAFYE